MNIVKGFTSINDFVDNTPGAVAPIGEISKWSLTYTREIGQYLDSTVPGYQFLSFKSIESVTGVAQPVSSEQAREILQVVKECLSYASSHVRPYDTLDFQNNISVAFYQRIEDFQFGPFIDNGSLALPEWISWTSTQNGGNQVKTWLADEAFKTQYDEYHIEVIPMIDTLDNFFFAYGTVVGLLDQVSISNFVDKMQERKLDHPETYSRVLTFDFVNTLNPAQTYKTNWGVLIYGQQGDNVDNMKDAIVEFILANSSHNKADWEKIIPTLFRRTEFVLFPRFDLLSIRDQTDLASLYKSMMDPTECMTFANRAIDFYPAEFIAENTIIFPFAHKALTLVSVNGDTNVETSKRLDLIFPDYIPIPSTSEDFNRMKPQTRNWALFLQRLLIEAETATIYSALPDNMRKQMRSGNLYISGIYDNINYLVAARSNKALYPNVE